MSVDLEGDEGVSNGEPSRRTFLKVSAVAGATVAAIAAGASVIPKIASSATAVKSASATGKPESEATTTLAAALSVDPLILVVRGEAVDVYRGESKVAVQDASLAKELASRISAKMQ